MSVYQTGTSVHLVCTFQHEENGELTKVDPDEVKIKFMNTRYHELEEVELNKEEHTTEVGEWFYNYVVPNEEMTIIYEWQGVYAFGQAFKRSEINAVFI